MDPVKPRPNITFPYLPHEIYAANAAKAAAQAAAAVKPCPNITFPYLPHEIYAANAAKAAAKGTAPSVSSSSIVRSLKHSKL